MSFAGAVWIFAGAVAFVVVAHEFGHYITAKRFGMKVEAFFFGFGPKLFSWRRGETEYGMRLLPAGGYVKIAGMNPFREVDDADASRTFLAKARWQRAVVLSAGSTMHFLLALLLLWSMFVFIGEPVAHPDVVIGGIVAGEEGDPTPAAQAGLRAGDRIVAIDGGAMDDWDTVVDYINDRPNEEITLTVERDGRTREYELIPAPEKVEVDGEVRTVGRIGIFSDVGFEPVAPHRAVAVAGVETYELIKLSVVGVVRFFSPEGLGRLVSSLSGQGARQVEDGDADAVSLIGAGRIAGEVGSESLFGLLQLVAIVYVFIGLLNLAPLPPLDGGYLAVLAYEKVFDREVDLRKLVPISAAVMILLIAIGVALIYLDLVRPIDFSQ